jgi:hypothetical protein
LLIQRRERTLLLMAAMRVPMTMARRMTTKMASRMPRTMEKTTAFRKPAKRMNPLVMKMPMPKKMPMPMTMPKKMSMPMPMPLPPPMVALQTSGWPSTIPSASTPSGSPRAPSLTATRSAIN